VMGKKVALLEREQKYYFLHLLPQQAAAFL